MRYVIEERQGDLWVPANLPESAWTNDRGRALAILYALGSRRFRVRNTSAVQTLMSEKRRPIYVSRSRDRGTGPSARWAAGGTR